ncbi:recombination regulator RecX [Syntrophotalea carbinolica DSM 2380]|uniref:Regulatory protein RecX n=1 Tax=Syntrophotalea carbinolica (strain DSM 2380 / NBRC 103641 / GraBd1) TaxID=338963 RepID=RECX_SYNC1|nr:regulatory protein RecX [Syntrophotalea carbinolica]Q3A1W1.3 RecName: Full=Regulatory protein RecX [Syntrophotalea carbinolica DSM 2380]ABA89646.3 recombination regulator RecX [Syntrophotalea carbinolica DSM 2380]
MAPRTDAWSSALRLLSRREYSEAMLRERLQRKGFDSDQIEHALERCRSYNYVNDERFARIRARQLLASGRAVGPALMADLRHQRIGDSIARKAINDLEEEFSQAEILKDLCQRRFPDFDFQTADDRSRRRVFNYLRRRGFASAVLFQYFSEER